MENLVSFFLSLLLPWFLSLAIKMNYYNHDDRCYWICTYSRTCVQIAIYLKIGWTVVCLAEVPHCRKKKTLIKILVLLNLKLPNGFETFLWKYLHLIIRWVDFRIWAISPVIFDMSYSTLLIIMCYSRALEMNFVNCLLQQNK